MYETLKANTGTPATSISLHFMNLNDFEETSSDVTFESKSRDNGPAIEIHAISSVLFVI